MEKPKPEPTYLDSLSPTLGDYLLSIEKEKSQGESEIEKTSVPEINTEMELACVRAIANLAIEHGRRPEKCASNCSAAANWNT